jgi:hypothetical protein
LVEAQCTGGWHTVDAERALREVVVVLEPFDVEHPATAVAARPRAAQANPARRITRLTVDVVVSPPDAILDKRSFPSTGGRCRALSSGVGR